MKSELSMAAGLSILVRMVRKYSGWSLVMQVTILDSTLTWSVLQSFSCP